MATHGSDPHFKNATCAPSDLWSLPSFKTRFPQKILNLFCVFFSSEVTITTTICYIHGIRLPYGPLFRHGASIADILAEIIS